MAFDFSNYVQLVLAGISTGSIYVLVALGIVLIYNVTGIVNLAQGEFAMLGAMLAVTYYGWHLPLAVAFLAAVLSVMAIGMLLERLTVNPARSASPVTLIMITVGVSITVRGIALLTWGTTPYSLPSFSKGAPLNVLGAMVSQQRLWVLAAGALALLLLYYLLERTLLGKALRACAINQRAAGFVGISSNGMSLLAYTLSAALGAVGGIVIAPLTLVSYDMGLILGLKGFVVAVIGGLISAPVTVIGGLLLGIAESLAAGLISSGLKDAIAFLVLLIVIFVRSEQMFKRLFRTRT
jgi:branched-chain amino acid transport system permease protein